MSKKEVRKNWTFHFAPKYDTKQDFYSYYVFEKKKWNKWWLLLLLVPLSMLIQCERQIDTVCVEPQTGIEIDGINVDMHYNAYLVKDATGLKWMRRIERTEMTDSAGVAKFDKLPCSVFSYVFCCLSKAYFSAKSECYMATDQECNFHYTRTINLDMDPRREDLYIKVVDLETDDCLPDASVVYEYTDGNEAVVDSTTTDAGGVAVLKGIRFCSNIDRISASRYGYADTLARDVDARELVSPSDDMALRLRPIKENFTFFVKDKETKQPIPAALAIVTLTHPNGSQISSELHTSIDGKGIAMYDDAFILSTIAIHASKLHYKDGDLEGGPWTVDKFKPQPDDVRTVWLEAEPYVVNFVNVDSITETPIPNVKNHIKVTDPAGNVEEYEEVSNSNGVFPVKAKEGSVIEIISDNAVGYKDKFTRIPKFSGPEKVRMQPKMVKMRFRTLDLYNGTVLPDCRLVVRGSISGNLPPSTSGSGEFMVEARYTELLSIGASKAGYLPNTTSVQNARVSELEVAPQSRRDIPLKLDLPPCEGGVNVPKASNENLHTRSYAMGQMSGTTYVDCDFYDWADYLTVYDGASATGTPVVPKQKIQNQKTVPVRFTKGAITVVIESSQGNSSWEYVVRCPN